MIIAYHLLAPFRLHILDHEEFFSDCSCSLRFKFFRKDERHCFIPPRCSCTICLVLFIASECSRAYEHRLFNHSLLLSFELFGFSERSPYEQKSSALTSMYLPKCLVHILHISESFFPLSNHLHSRQRTMSMLGAVIICTSFTHF